MNLSPAATIVLTRAAERADLRLEFHRKLPTAARHKMIDALLRQSLIAETQGDYRLGDGSLLVENAGTGLMLTTLALTGIGLHATDRHPPGASEAAHTGATDARAGACDSAVAQEALSVANALDADHDAPVAATPRDTARTTLRQAAAAVLEQWDDQDNQQYGLPQAIDQLRALLAPKPTRPPSDTAAPRTPRQGTKQQAVLALLHRADGATIAQVMETTGWAPHIVRGFLAGLKKKGHAIDVLDRVKMVGPDKAGAKGSYSVYRVATPVAV